MGRARISLSLAVLAGCGGAVLCAPPAGAAEGPGVIVDGPARIQVLSPTLFRLEYAADGRFEDRPTLTAPRPRKPVAQVRTRVRRGKRVIATGRATLSYRIGAGPFSPQNLTLRLKGGGRKGKIHPAFPGATVPPPGPKWPGPTPANPNPDPAPATSGNLGGWYRGLDGQPGPVQLHEGVLSREGWYLLDDTISPLLTERGRWYEPRSQRPGAYQDGYLFAYGRDYRAALGDFRSLTGPAPLIPRQAFGVWFSRYSFYSATGYAKLLERFRSARVPLDVLVVDTDFKAPNPWNGWGWSPRGFPDPQGFFGWAHEEGLDVVLNIHPSITEQDPAFGAADAGAGGLPPDSGNCNPLTEAQTCRVWDWASRRHVSSYFSLHAPFEAQGADFWWLDWNRDESRVSAPGLTPDSWINLLYAERQRERGSRWLPLSRIGSSMTHYGRSMPGVWAEHRNAIHFTGDAQSTWDMLDFQSRFTTAEGAGIGMPYVSHDIGGFLGRKLEPELYVRWVQFGAFQPILRLHSDHGQRLPWEYPRRAERIAGEFLRLRNALAPYTYTAAREAHESGLPMARPMYLEWPRADAAYRFDRQYKFGDSLLVAPIASPGARSRERVWFPPGEWVDLFTGRRYEGPRARTLATPLDRMPVFARAGSIIPRQPYAPNLERPARKLELSVYAGDNGQFQLYEDAGEGLAYRRKEFSRTRFRWRERRDRATLVIGRANGSYEGQPGARSYAIEIQGVERPRTVRIGEQRLRRWSYDAAARTLTLRLGRSPVRKSAKLGLAFRPRR